MKRSLQRTIASLTVLAAVAVLAAATPAPLRAMTPSRSVQRVTLYVFPTAAGLPGPDGQTHAAFVPANVAVHVGRPVKVTIVDYQTYDDGQHTIVAPGLSLRVPVRPAVRTATGQLRPATTTFSFKAAKKGVFRWSCQGPSDDTMGMGGGPASWEMGQGYSGPGREGFMAGFIVVF